MTTEELNTIHIEPQNDSTVKITGEIPFAYLEKHRADAVAHLGKNIEVDGFRKGNIPEKVLVDRIGEGTLLSEMAERALSKAYPLIVEDKKLEVIGYPQVSITKLAAGNPLGFSAVVAIMPEITLPDYKAIAKDVAGSKESADVTDEEVQTQINEILRQKVAYERLQKTAAEKKDGDDETPETHTHTDGTVHEGPAHDEETPIEKAEDIPLPELTDELIKTVGQPGQFENVDDFKAKIREHLEIQKKQDATSKHRANITDAIIEKTVVIVPEVMVEAEMNQMFAQMEQDLVRAGLSMEDYLGHLKKTKDDLKTEWRPSAEKRAKLQLVLNEIGEKESITPNPEVLEQEVAKLLEQHKDADVERVRVYVASVLTNEAVISMLEGQ